MQLIHGDCLIEMKDIPDKSIDMILCDLPYGTTACKWDVVIPFEPLWIEYKRIIKDRGCIALFGSEPFSSYLRMSNIKNYKYDWYWNKNRPGGIITAKFQPLKAVETISIFNSGIYYFQKIARTESELKRLSKKSKTSNKGFYSESIKTYTQEREKLKEKYCNNILDFKVVHSRDSVKTDHPTQKPVALLEYLIKTYTLEGETVLDNCMGSGSTGVACVNTSRNFIGIEKDGKYFEIAKKRIENALSVKRLEELRSQGVLF